jgi:archaellum component FlaC
MSETTSPDLIARRLDGLQNSIAGLSRRMITLEAGVNDRIGAVEARMAGLEDCADQLVERISALETRVNCLILLVERIAKP